VAILVAIEGKMSNGTRKADNNLRVWSSIFFRKIDINNVDFTTATLVYNNTQQYIRKLFKNSMGLPRLSYYDGSDQLIITDITA
jgi:hypothetical protein